MHEEPRGKRQADGELRFRRPDGSVIPAVPVPAAVPNDPAIAIRDQHNAQGLHIDARTSRPGWLGERLDVGYAIDVLHPRANQPKDINEEPQQP